MIKIYRTKLATRIIATVLGIAAILFGAFAFSVQDQAPSDILADRAFWFGLTLMFAGVSAILVSWLVSDLSNIWCRPPRRSGY